MENKEIVEELKRIVDWLEYDIQQIKYIIHDVNDRKYSTQTMKIHVTDFLKSLSCKYLNNEYTKPIIKNILEKW